MMLPPPNPVKRALGSLKSPAHLRKPAGGNTPKSPRTASHHAHSSVGTENSFMSPLTSCRQSHLLSSRTICFPFTSFTQVPGHLLYIRRTQGSQNVAWTQSDVCPIPVCVAASNLRYYESGEFIQELATEGDFLDGVALASNGYGLLSRVVRVGPGISWAGKLPIPKISIAR